MGVGIAGNVFKVRGYMIVK